MNHQQISKLIIDCAFEVQRTLGNGLTKSIYENALSIELADRGFSHLRNASEPIHYKKNPKMVGKLTADFIVNDSILVEVLNKKDINDLHLKSFRRKLFIFQCEEGLLINFESRNVTFKRVTG